MRQWLNRNSPVDKEDLERHDKWLCMMWPRLHLLKELLSEDGAIFVSIDDNEQHHLRMMLTEIFGEENFVANIIWQKKFSPQNDAKYFSDNHDFIVCFAKNKKIWRPNLLPRTESHNKRFKNLDNDSRGPWSSSGLDVKTYSEVYDYPILTPSGRTINPPPNRCWRCSKEKFEKLVKDNRIWFGADGNNVPRVKRFLSEVQQGITPLTIWTYKEVGHSQGATRGLNQMNVDFPNPKPHTLIEHVLKLASGPGDIVLDSFAGSGTTAHAVLALNKKDGGNRKFILIECEDYANSITANRVRKVISGYKFKGTQSCELMREKLNWSKIRNSGSVVKKVQEIEETYCSEFDKFEKSIKNNELIILGKKKIIEKTEGLGGSFKYCTLGEPVDLDGMLTGEKLPSFSSLATYLIHTASGISIGETELECFGKVGLFYSNNSTTYHLFYKPDSTYLQSNKAMLNEKRAKEIRNIANGRKAIVFGPGRYIKQKDLTQMGITFCQLPYEIYRV